jgi:hypothetical protein
MNDQRIEVRLKVAPDLWQKFRAAVAKAHDGRTRIKRGPSWVEAELESALHLYLRGGATRKQKRMWPPEALLRYMADVWKVSPVHIIGAQNLTFAVKKYGDVIDDRTVDKWIGRLTREGYLVMEYDGDRRQHVFVVQGRVLTDLRDLAEESQ